MPSLKYFPYYGPSRRSDTPVVEIRLDFGVDDRNTPPVNSDQLRNLLIEGGVLEEQETFPQDALPDDGRLRYASLFLQTALLLQRKAGHEVDYYSLSNMEDRDQCLALLEHEHYDVAMTAARLAFELVDGRRRVLKEPFSRFRDFANERAIKPVTRAIIDAANRRDIPHTRLERHLYTRPLFEQLVAGDDKHEGGLLMLGNGVHQHILDGVLCIDRSPNLQDLVADRGQRLAMLRQLDIPVAQPGNRIQSDLDTHFFVSIDGLIMGAGKLASSVRHEPEDVHESLIDAVLAISRALDSVPVVVSVVTADISQPLAPGQSCVLDFDVAPDLETYLATSSDEDSGLLRSTAGALLDWLFPADSEASIPIIAITGTNGKTTTTRMVNHIMMQAGRRPGMTCTDGILVNGEKVASGDYCAVTGHMNVLTNPDVDIAVLETHHRGILDQGFAFRHCDVAVCLNVSEDHVVDGRVAGLEQMAELKRALPERASHAAVLFADDPHCLAMLDSMTADNIALVSMRHDVDELRARTGGKATGFCVLEWIGDREWLVVYDGDRRAPVMEVAGMPVTCDGKARFNVSNAMHAVLAAYYAGVGMETIREAMAGFASRYDTTPGRLNDIDTLPFRVIMDFAHNPDGLEKLCEYIDLLDVSGKKLLAFAGMGSRADQTIRKKAHSVAGHFDFYFCKEYSKRTGNPKRDVAHILQQGLFEKGVPENKTMVLTAGREVTFKMFDECEPGDLLVMIVGYVEQHHLAGIIEEYARKTGAST